MTVDLAVRVAVSSAPDSLDIWVTLEDFHQLTQDEFLYGDTYVEKIPDLPEGALVTHRRIRPDSVRAA
jgi:hypothetical protein